MLKIKKRFRKFKYENSAGFTLIELLVVIAIMGLMASIMSIALKGVRSDARDTKRKADIAQIRKAIEIYYQDNNFYPDAGTTPNREVDIQFLKSALVPKYLTLIPNDPSSWPNNYEYVYSKGSAQTPQDYGIYIPFGNDGGTECAWRTAGGNANWFKAGPITVPNCTY